VSDFRPIGSMLPCCGSLVCDFLFKLILERMQNSYKRANQIFFILFYFSDQNATLFGFGL
jgi:hypothetical protein